MRKMIDPRRPFHAKALAILAVAALVTAVVGCEPAVMYSLTIESTAGGAVTTPGERTTTYEEGSVVDLVAEPEEGCFFLNWTGDVGTIADVEAAETTITMKGDHEITANFARMYLAPPDYNLPGIYSSKPTTGHMEIGIYIFQYRISNLIDGSYEEGDWVDIECGHYHGNPCGTEDRIKQCSENTITISIGPDVEENDCYVSGEAACRLELYYMACNGQEASNAYFFNVGWQLIASSTDGGSVIIPAESDSPLYYKYDEVVELVAIAESGYAFVNWTGDVDTVALVEAEETTITMDDNHAIVANFEIIQQTLAIDSPTVAMSTVVGETTSAEKRVVVGLLALLFVTLSVWAIRRKGRAVEYR